MVRRLILSRSNGMVLALPKQIAEFGGASPKNNFRRKTSSIAADFIHANGVLDGRSGRKSHIRLRIT